ncbi:hypothetical protein SDJN03_30209, partial [Cucurbita argyrosperma subsp. sororia]
MADRPQPHQSKSIPSAATTTSAPRAAQAHPPPQSSTIITLVPLGGSLLRARRVDSSGDAAILTYRASRPGVLDLRGVRAHRAVFAYVGFHYVRRAMGFMPDQIDQAKRRMQDMAGIVGQKDQGSGAGESKQDDDDPPRLRNKGGGHDEPMGRVMLWGIVVF